MGSLHDHVKVTDRVVTIDVLRHVLCQLVSYVFSHVTGQLSGHVPGHVKKPIMAKLRNCLDSLWQRPIDQFASC